MNGTLAAPVEDQQRKPSSELTVKIPRPGDVTVSPYSAHTSDSTTPTSPSSSPPDPQPPQQPSSQRSYFELPPVATTSATLLNRPSVLQALPVPELPEASTTISTAELARDSTNGLSAASAKSWVKRVQARTDELRKLFGLPASEQLMDEYMCALKKRVLLQGRMYVFEHHICFHSSVFGHSKIKSIPLEAVEDVRKRKNVGFPNSVEILWQPAAADGGGDHILKKEFFTSFISREDAYRLVLGLWAQHTQRGRERLADTEATEDDTATTSQVQPSIPGAGGGGGKSKRAKSMLRKAGLGAKGAIPEDTDGYDHDADAITPREDGLDNHTTPFWGQEEQPTTSNNSNNSRPLLLGGENNNNLQSSSYSNRLQTDNSLSGAVSLSGGLAQHPDAPPPTTTAAAGAAGGGGRPSSDYVSQAHLSGGEGVVEFEERHVGNRATMNAEFDAAKEEAPPVAEGMTEIMHTIFQCTPRDFWMYFLSGESDFFVAYHEHQNHRNIRLDSWQHHIKMGNVRDLRFVNMFKGWRSSAQQALCHQTQRYQVYRGDHLVFETSQVMSEIPYSDHFKVETRWDIRPAGPNRCEVTTHIQVPFNKQTMWKKFIERSVTDSILEALNVFTTLAELKISANNNNAVAPGLQPTESGRLLLQNVSRTNSAKLEDTLPESNEDWEALLAQVPSQWRGGLRSLRKVQLSGGPGAVGGSRPGHRRRGSKGGSSFSSDALMTMGSPGGPMPPTMPLLATLQEEEQQQQLRVNHNKSPSPGPKKPRAAGGAGSSFMRRNGMQVVLGVLLGIVMTLQLVLLVVLLRPSSSSSGDIGGGGSGGIGGFSTVKISRELNAVLKQVEGLQGDAEVWQNRLSMLLQTSGQLVEHVGAMQRQLEAAAAASNGGSGG